MVVRYRFARARWLDAGTREWQRVHYEGTSPGVRESSNAMLRYKGSLYLLGGYNGTEWLKDLHSFHVGEDGFTSSSFIFYFFEAAGGICFRFSGILCPLCCVFTRSHSNSSSRESFSNANNNFTWIFQGALSS